MLSVFSARARNMSLWLGVHVCFTGSASAKSHPEFLWYLEKYNLVIQYKIILFVYQSLPIQAVHIITIYIVYMITNNFNKYK